MRTTKLLLVCLGGGPSWPLKAEGPGGADTGEKPCPHAWPRQVAPLVLARTLTLSVGRTRLRVGSQQSNGFTDRPRIIQRPHVGAAYPEAR